MPRHLFLIALVPLLAAQDASFSVTEVMVPMRDGVRLATDLYLPARDGRPLPGRFPTLLSRTPYDKRGARNDALALVTHGFAVLIQDCRGRFRSEGSFYPFVNEPQDGYDAIEWAAAQPWSDSRIGTFGASYLAWDQFGAAIERPPHLAAMFAVVGGSNFYQDYAYPGGVPNLGWSLWLLRSAQSSPLARAKPELAAPIAATVKDGLPAYLRAPVAERRRLFEPFPDHLRAFDDYVNHPDFDDSWRKPAFHIAGHYAQMKDVPTLYLSGWFDYFAEGTLDVFSHLSRRHRSPQRLVMGPWPHATGNRRCGDADFGPGAALDLRALMAEWFGHFLQGKPAGAWGAAKVRLFVMGGGPPQSPGGQWRAFDTWPPPSRPRRWYLRAQGALSPTVPPPAPPSTFTHDPAHPVPTIGGRYGLGDLAPNCSQNLLCRPGILGCASEQPLAGRPDLITFLSEPLSAPLDIAGMAHLRVFLSSSATDTDVVARLAEVYPNGYARTLLEGQLRASRRAGFTRAVPLVPGRPVELAIPLGSLANRFLAGNRIRLDIQSSTFPRSEPHPLKARNAVHHAPGRASYLELPLLRP